MKGINTMKKLNEFTKEYGDYFIKDEDTLLKLLEKPRPMTVYGLQHGDKYWYINSDGSIDSAIWEDCDVDHYRRNQENCYLTEEKCEFTLERKKVIAEMKRLGGTEDMMSLGDVDDRKYYIWYDHYDSIIHIGICTYSHNISDVYFATRELAQKVIDKIGEDKIKKYLFFYN